jgi:hypothetical protein
MATCINLLVLIEQKLGFQLTFPTQEPVEADRGNREGVADMPRYNVLRRSSHCR